MADTVLKRRAKRKVAKKKNADARESFNATQSGFVDHSALRKSMALLPEREGNRRSSSQPRALAAPAPLAFPNSNTNRWVPIGPSAVRKGQAEGGPRISGRVRDLAVSADGTRAYAATAKGGVWYTGDGGATWEPIGGWANEPRTVGGNTSAFASGCLLVSFGVNVAGDFVMVGTGEFGAFQSSANAAPMGGMGVFVASSLNPSAVQSDPWENATGINVFEGFTIVRMARVPRSPPGPVPGDINDQVIAAANGGVFVTPAAGQLPSTGLFLGTRSDVGGTRLFTWAPLASPVPPLPALAGVTTIQDPTDLVYVGTRLFVCFRHCGVAVSDNNGTSFTWVAMTLNAALPAASVLLGRMSISVNDDNNTVYILGEANTTPAAANASPVAQVWQITNATVATRAALVATPLGGVPTSAQLWGGQRDYDQAIEALTYTPPAAPPPPARIDRIYIGGSLAGGPPVGGAIAGLRNWNASIWAFDVVGAALVPAPGISNQVAAGITHGPNLPGLIGNAVHPDVHALRKATNADGSRQIWVGCDGGVFASLSDGQVNTFSSRNTGLASIEVGFIDSHPTSSHFTILGCQDNGVQVRVGESVWEVKGNMQNDGGGVIFHPVQSHFVMGQFIRGSWRGDPVSRYVQPIRALMNDPENNPGSAFYSAASASQPVGNRARIAIGTNRVWVTDNLGTASPNTWNVLPISPGGVFAAVMDPRPGTVANPGLRNPVAANQAFGVPGLGAVLTVKWVNSVTLLALYTNGVVRYVEQGPSTGRWTSTLLYSIAMPVPAAPLVNPLATAFTDIEPVPGTNDFYLTCTGQISQWVAATPAVPAIPPNPAIPAVAAQPPIASADSCFYFDNNLSGFVTTGLGQALPPAATSPIDPAYSVVIDPANPNNVYVGTVTGVWLSTRTPGAPGAPPTHSNWTLFDNGLPQSTVQDLTIWSDPAGGVSSPRLLRAALQSRGVWEVNLASTEPARTYLRVHERDDRRMFPTPLKNPRRRPNAPNVPVIRSPDITIRPRAPVANTPSFRNRNLTDATLKYQLWTFQTAFRWLFPSVMPDGQWTDQFADLVERYRRSLPNPIPNPLPVPGGVRRIDALVWNTVMQAAQDENGNPGVYRAPWQNALSAASPATEIDLIETVVPRRDRNALWQVYREPSTVDVLLHHRDTRPVPANSSAAVLLWRTHRRGANLMATDCTAIVAYAQSLFTAAPLPVPAGWNVELATDGTHLHRLSVPLAARMPRAVSINIDLSAVPTGHRVLLLALSGSTVDPFTAATAAPIDTVARFVRNWPHAACRLISCWRRPGTQLH